MRINAGFRASLLGAARRRPAGVPVRVCPASPVRCEMDASQREFFKRNGYLVIKGALSPSTVAALNAAFEKQLLEEKPPSAIVWHMNRDRDSLRPDGSLAPRKLLHNDLACPPKVGCVLRELCSSFEWGHLHPDTPPDKIGRFRLDLDGAHWISPFDPNHTPDEAVDFPAEAIEYRKAAGLPAPFSSGLGWTPQGILQGGLHGGPPLFHISCLYELQSVGPGDGGFSCLAGSHLAGARIGLPGQEQAVQRGHMPWGKQPWS